MAYIGSGISRFNTADELTVTGDAVIDTTTLVVDSTNNRVGILNASPTTALDVTGTVTATGLTVLNTGAVATLRLEGDVGTAPHAEVQFAHENYTTGYGASIGTFDAGSFGGGLVFKTLASGSASSTPSEVMRLDTSGNLLVGGTSLGENGAVTMGGDGRIYAIRASDTAGFFGRTGADGSIVNFTKDGTTVGVIGTQSWGIGTASPTSASGGKVLAVETTADEHTNLVFNTANTGRNGIIEGRRTGRSGSERFAQINIENNSDNGEIRFYTAGSGSDVSERMRLSGSNLLVGTTDSNPANNSGSGNDGVAIHPDSIRVARTDGDMLLLNRLNSDGDIVKLNKDGATVGVIGTIGGDMVAGTGDTGLRFHDGADQVYPSNTNGSGRDAAIDLGNSGARFKDGYFAGNIRTDSTLFAPSFTCYPNGSAPTADAAIYRPQDGTLGFVSNGSEKARFASDGNLYIAKTSDTATGVGLTLSGGGFIRAVRNEICGVFNRQGSDGTLLSFARSNSGVGAISVTTSATTYSTSSDRRLKSNIQDAASASDKIDAIQVRQFDWNADDSHQDYGLIAQELQPIEPMAVTGDADSDEMMGVDYSKLVPMLIKEIQELRGRVAALEAN